MLQKRLVWALFVLLLSILVCCQSTELILGFFFLFHNFSILLHPGLQRCQRQEFPQLLAWRPRLLRPHPLPSVSCSRPAELGPFYYHLCLFLKIFWDIPCIGWLKRVPLHQQMNNVASHVPVRTSSTTSKLETTALRTSRYAMVQGLVQLSTQCGSNKMEN